MATLTWQLGEVENIGGYPTTLAGRPEVREHNGESVLYFGGKDGILLPTHPLVGKSSFSCTVELSPERGGEREQRFLHAGTPQEDRMLIELRSLPDDCWYLDVYLSLGGRSIALRDEKKRHETGRRYRAALSFDGEYLRGMVDGVTELEGELPRGLPTSGSSTMIGGACSIGMRQNRVSFFTGTIHTIVWSFD